MTLWKSQAKNISQGLVNEIAQIMFFLILNSY